VARVGNTEDAAALRGCARLGGLQIRAAGLIDLGGLAGLRAVTGDVVVGPTTGLDNLDALAGLEEVGGDLTVTHGELLTGAYLSSLRRVGGDLVVTRNPALAGLVLRSLEEVGGDLRITGNPVLLALSADRLAKVGGTLVVDGNPALEAGTAETLRARLTQSSAGSVRPGRARVRRGADQGGGDPAPIDGLRAQREDPMPALAW
jgi:hypothetical protein